MFLVIHVLTFLIVLFGVILLMVTQRELQEGVPRRFDITINGVVSTKELGNNCYATKSHEHGAIPWLVIFITYYWSNELWNCVRYFVVAFTTGVWYFRNESLAAQSGQVSVKHYTRQPVRIHPKSAALRSRNHVRPEHTGGCPPVHRCPLQSALPSQSRLGQSVSPP